MVVAVFTPNASPSPVGNLAYVQPASLLMPHAQGFEAPQAATWMSLTRIPQQPSEALPRNALMARRTMPTGQASPASTLQRTPLAVAALLAMGAEGCCCEMTDDGMVGPGKISIEALLIGSALFLAVAGTAAFLGLRARLKPILTIQQAEQVIKQLPEYIEGWQEMKPRKRLQITETLLKSHRLDLYNLLQESRIRSFFAKISNLPGTDRGAILFQMMQHRVVYYGIIDAHLDKRVHEMNRDDPLEKAILSFLSLGKNFPTAKLELMDYIERKKPASCKALLKNPEWQELRQRFEEKLAQEAE